MLRDGSVALIWLIENILLGVAVWRFANWNSPNETLAGRVLQSSILYCAFIVGLLVLLGAVGLFTSSAILTMAGIAAVTLYALTGRMMSSLAPRQQTQAVPWGWWLAFCMLTVHCVTFGLMTLPTDFDCLMYHLPLVDAWLQAGSLYEPRFGQWSTPGGSELLAAWCCAPFSGDFLAPLNNLPVVVIWAAASLELARLLGLGRGWAELATASTLTVYTLLHETDDASNDLMVVATFMAAIVYTLRYAMCRDRFLLPFAGISLGLLYGVKYFAVCYAAVVWCTFVAAVFVAYGWRQAFWAGVVVGLFSLPFGGYWYVRNFVLTGLPLYPLGEPQVLGYPNLQSTSLFGNGHPELWPLFFRAIWRLAGPIHLTAVGGLPVVIAGLLASASHSRRQKRGEPKAYLPWVTAAVLLAGSAAILWRTPFLVEDQPETLNHLRWAYTPIRYGLCFLSLNVMCAFAVTHALCRALPQFLSRAIFWGLVAIELWQIIQRILLHSREFNFTITIFVGMDLMVLFLAAAWVARRLPRHPRWRGAFVVAVCLPLAAGIGMLSDRWHAGFPQHFDRLLNTDAFAILSADQFDGVSICVLTNRPYAFFGSRREHVVVNPRRFITDTSLDELLQVNRVRLIAAGSRSGGTIDRYRGADEYLDKNRDTISLLTRTSRLRLGLIHRQGDGE